MQTLAVIRRLVSMSTLVFAVAGAYAQTHPEFASSDELNTAKAACKSDLNVAKLEDDTNVRNAATRLAKQVLSLYNSDPTKQPDISSKLGDFHLAVLSAIRPVCTAEVVTSNKALNAGSAEATTGQTNKQVGGPSSSEGSTSVVQKVGIPQLLGIAVENGAVTNNVTGTTMTLSTTPYAFVYAFAKSQDTQQRYEKNPLFTHLGFSATFNIADTSNPLESVTRKDISQWQTKVTFRDTSIRSGTVNDMYQQDVNAPANNVLADETNPVFAPAYKQLSAFETNVFDRLWTQSLKTMAAQPLASGDTEGTQKATGIATQLLQALDQDAAYQSALQIVKGEVNTDPGNLSFLIQRFEADNTKYQAAQKKFENDVADVPKGWNGDVSFGQNYPTSTSTTTTATASGSSSTSTVPPPTYLSAAATTSSSTTSTPATPAYLVAEFDVTCQPKAVSKQKVPCLPLGGGGTFTGNFSGSFYTNPNPVLNETTFRGVTGAVQAQWDLGPGVLTKKAANDNSKMTLSVGSNYQRLQENKDQTGKRPDIVLGNLKLEIPISSGVSIPLSFSVANATQQIKETYVKGNFGVSFDLDKLASLLKANQ